MLVVGGFPSAEVDAAGKSGRDAEARMVWKAVEEAGYSADDCWMTYAGVCHPTDSHRSGKGKSAIDRSEYCRPNLVKEIERLRPRVVILLGPDPIRSIIGSTFRESTGAADRWYGWKIPLQKWNCWVCPTYHPTDVDSKESNREGAVYALWFRRHIEAAMHLSGSPPWETVPKYSNNVRILLDPSEIRDAIDRVIDVDQGVAFDYETNCLKPDRSDADIISCAFTFGDKAFAFPFLQEIRKKWAEFLQSNTKKIGANTKFEERWSRRVLNVGINRWVWDTVLSAHHLDNRPDITSVKFQAYVRLGLSPWDEQVSPYLQAEDAVSLNRIRECDLRTLLTYNGVDAIAELGVARSQMKEMKAQNV